MIPFFRCTPFGARTTVFNNNYYSMPPMMGCNCQSNFFNKMSAYFMMSSLMQNMFRPMAQYNYYPQQSYYPGLYLSGGGTEGAGGASNSSSEQNLKNLQDFYGDCRFSSITENGVTRYYCCTPDGTVYTDTSLTDLQKQLEINGVTPKQKKEKSSSTDEVSLTRREDVDDTDKADEADGADKADGAGEAGGADKAGDPDKAGGAGSRTYKRADLSSISGQGYIWVKYNDLTNAQKEKLKDCKTITQLMQALNSPEFGTTNLKTNHDNFHKWYRDANPNAIDGDNIVDITKLDLIVRQDYEIGSENLVRSKDLKFAYSVSNAGIKYYKRGDGGYLVECKENEISCPNMVKNAKSKYNKLKKDAPSESKIAQYRYITGPSNSQKLDYNGGNVVYKKNGTGNWDDDAIFKIDGKEYTIQHSYSTVKLDFCEITDMRSLGADFKLIDSQTGHFNQDINFWRNGNYFKKFILKNKDGSSGPLADCAITWDNNQNKVVLQKGNKSYIMDNIMVGYEKIT